MGGDSAMQLEDGEWWAHDLIENKLISPLQTLIENSPEYIRAVALHEGSHRDITRYRPSDSKYTFFFQSEVMQLLLNVIEDTRVNNNVDKRFPGRGMLDAIYDAEWPKDMGQKGETEKGKGLLADYGVTRIKTGEEKPKELLPYMQYAHGIVYLWRHQEIADFIVDEEVRELITRQRPLLEELSHLLPAPTEVPMPDGSTYQISPSENSKLAAMDTLIERIHNEILPDYERLVEKSKQEVEDLYNSGDLEQVPPSLKN